MKLRTGCIHPDRKGGKEILPQVPASRQLTRNAETTVVAPVDSGTHFTSVVCRLFGQVEYTPGPDARFATQ